MRAHEGRIPVLKKGQEVVVELSGKIAECAKQRWTKKACFFRHRFDVGEKSLSVVAKSQDPVGEGGKDQYKGAQKKKIQKIG
jgi:hypothetical protein